LLTGSAIRALFLPKSPFFRSALPLGVATAKSRSVVARGAST
jgi:hypothetical protein